MPPATRPVRAPPPAALPPHAIFPIRRAVPPVSWPLQRHDWLALIFTVCFAALFWNLRHVVILVVIVYLLGRGYVYLCYRFPRAMWFVTVLLCGLLGSGRRRRW
jgi:hypothetical protein